MTDTTAKPSDADVLAAVINGARAEEYERSNEHALYDFKRFPAIVRGFLALNFGNATETLAIEEAGFMPALYGRKNGKACRVIMVSSMGDIGITFKNNRYGYSERCSIYDLDEGAFTLEKPDDLPEPPPEPKYDLDDDARIQMVKFIPKPRPRRGRSRTKI